MLNDTLNKIYTLNTDILANEIPPMIFYCYNPILSTPNPTINELTSYNIYRDILNNTILNNFLSNNILNNNLLDNNILNSNLSSNNLSSNNTQNIYKNLKNDIYKNFQTLSYGGSKYNNKINNWDDTSSFSNIKSYINDTLNQLFITNNGIPTYNTSVYYNTSSNIHPFNDYSLGNRYLDEHLSNNYFSNTKNNRYQPVSVAIDKNYQPLSSSSKAQLINSQNNSLITNDFSNISSYNTPNLLNNEVNSTNLSEYYYNSPTQNSLALNNLITNNQEYSVPTYNNIKKSYNINLKNPSTTLDMSNVVEYVEAQLRNNLKESIYLSSSNLNI